jgi:hypothetical protein
LIIILHITDNTIRKTASHILILGILLASCGLFSSGTEVTTRHILFTSLFQSFQTETAIHDFETVVLMNRADTETFLSEFPTDDIRKEILLNVNFSDSLIIGVFVGARPNTSYSVGIDSVVVSDNRNIVYITEVGSAAGFRAITWPAHFVVADKADFGNRTAAFGLKRICKLDPCSWPVSYEPG